MPERQAIDGELTDKLRQRIVKGEYAPGARLPTNRVLVAEFGVSSATVVQALAALVEEGFVRAEPRRATYVVKNPPHRRDLALAFPWPEQDLWMSSFYRDLRDAASRLSTPQRRFLPFYNLSGNVDASDYRRLLLLMQQRRLAGLIFTHAVWFLAGLPVVADLGVPRAAIMAPSAGTPFPTVYPDLDDFTSRALAWCAANGRRRVAHLFMTGFGSWQGRQQADYAAQAARYGLRTEPHWVQAAPAHDPAWARNLTRLLLAGPPDRRPDALVIHDDNLAPFATAGVADSGIRVPRNLAIVAQAHFPALPQVAVPVQFLGFSIDRLLERCLELLAAQRGGAMAGHAESLPADQSRPSDSTANTADLDASHPAFAPDAEISFRRFDALRAFTRGHGALERRERREAVVCV